MSSASGATGAKKKEELGRWYREQIREIVPRLFAKWERIIGVKVQNFYVRRMKTKWGSCNASAGTIRLNSEWQRNRESVWSILSFMKWSTYLNALTIDVSCL